MKITSLRAAFLVAVTFVILIFSGNQASAQTYIRVSSPPPPVVVEHRWAAPYRGAVWIGGHHEWVNGRWVWVSGYYSYPPRRGGYWVPGRYHHGYYYPGHWAY